MARPPKYETEKELQDKIDAYFEYLANDGSKLSPSITGLVLYLGFCDRASFYDLEKQPKFSHTIKRARSFIVEHYEQSLNKQSCTGAIFALKNFGWKDRQEIEQSGGVTLNIVRKLVDGKDS